MEVRLRAPDSHGRPLVEMGWDLCGREREVGSLVSEAAEGGWDEMDLPPPGWGTRRRTLGRHKKRQTGDMNNDDLVDHLWLLHGQ